MSEHETPLRTWRRDGTVDYVRIEARPARNKHVPALCQIVVESTPPGGEGACEAIHALFHAIMQHDTDETAREFWAALKRWAEERR